MTFTLGHEPALATGANTFTPTFFAAFATVEFSSPTVSIGDRRWSRRRVGRRLDHATRDSGRASSSAATSP